MDPNEGAMPGFNACYLIKKEMGPSKATGCKEASWDGTHIVMCAMDNNKKQSEYTVLSTVQLHIEAGAEDYGDLLIGGCNSKSI